MNTFNVIKWLALAIVAMIPVALAIVSRLPMPAYF